MNLTHGLSVQDVLPGLHGIHGLWVFKRQERKPSRPAIGVTHNRTGIHLNKRNNNFCQYIPPPAE